MFGTFTFVDSGSAINVWLWVLLIRVVEGKVYFGDHEAYDDETELIRLFLINDSFTEFLNSLFAME